MIERDEVMVEEISQDGNSCTVSISVRYEGVRGWTLYMYEQSCKIVWFVEYHFGSSRIRSPPRSLGLFALRWWVIQWRNLPNHIPVDPEPIQTCVLLHSPVVFDY